MDQVHVIRHEVLVEGQSIRRVVREMGVSRNTVRKYLGQSEPRRRELRPRGRPVWLRVAGRIEGLLEEWSGRTTAKQRVTGTRVHRQLVEEGFAVGITTVRRVLWERRRQRAEVYIPLVHRPGEEAQVDFFAVTVEEAGVQRQVWKLVVHLMYSGRDFAWLYDRCDQLAFLDGHVRAFAHFGGVPRRATYDNLSAAVKRRVGLDRELTDALCALSSHYLFEPCFARPGQGHDKGGVESRGKGIRLAHLTPIPRGDSLQAIATRLLEELDREAGRRRDRAGRTVLERFAEEATRLRALPEQPYEPRRVQLVGISRLSLARVEGADYSLPSHWSRLEATAYVGVEDIRFVCFGEQTTRRRARLHERRCVRYRDYLRELAGKPQALRQVAPELLTEMDEPYRRLHGLLVARHGELDAARVLSKILGCAHAHGEQAVGQALAAALAEARAVVPPAEPATHPAVVTVPERLAAIQVACARAADYDVLLAGGGR
jgi:transposase